MTAPGPAPSNRPSLSAGARIGLGLASAVLVLVVVGVIAGSPDGETDLVDPQHLGPRLVILSIILTVISGLAIFALSSRRPWVRAVGLVGAIVMAGAIIAVLEMPAVVPDGVSRPVATVRVAQAADTDLPGQPALFLVAPDAVLVEAPGRLTPAEIDTLSASVARLGGLAGLAPTDAPTSFDREAHDRLSFELATADPFDGLETAPLTNDAVPVVVGVQTDRSGTRYLDIGVVASERPQALPENTDDEIDEVVRDLRDAGYTATRIDVFADAAPPDQSRVDPAPPAPWREALLALGRFLLFATSVLAILGTLGGGIWWLGTRRFGWFHTTDVRLPAGTATQPLGAEAIRAELADELDRALDELPLEGDPRHVVLAAYVRMTAVLADHGIARDPADTPLEYLSRALAELDAATGPVEQLTRLMEVAMFSTRVVDAGMADEAVAAFRAVRDELRVPAPV